MESNSLAALKASITESLLEPGLARVIPSSEAWSPSMKTWSSFSEKPRKSWTVMSHLRTWLAREDKTAFLMYRPDLADEIDVLLLGLGEAAGLHECLVGVPIELRMGRGSRLRGWLLLVVSAFLTTSGP